jgi:alkylated DNA repair dioxygenase AlkB
MHFPGFLDINEKNLLPKEGILEYVYPFYNEAESQIIFDSLINSTPWKQEEMLMYERMVLLPRLNIRYGVDAIWPAILNDMKKKVELHTGETFNTVLLNLYRDNRDHVSWHSDRWKHPSDIEIIVSLSFGETRKFQVRHKTDTSIPVVSIDLKPGSLVIMKGGMQKNWVHRIAQTAKPLGPRINLTFRKIHYESS